jgi:peptidoglycan L-alanyl-D-glutamate endopeptidase CwlK
MLTHVELLGRINTRLLYPPFAVKLAALADRCEVNGWRYYATNGLRTVEEQDKLYSYGRTDMSRDIVTKARGGYSAHQYGVACDLCHDKDLAKPGLQPDYDKASYEVLAVEAAALGLEAGLRWASFPDAPHVQLPLKRHGLGWPALLDAYRKGGMSSVWRIFDRYQW